MPRMLFVIFFYSFTINIHFSLKVFSQQTATSEEVLLVPCRRATKQASLSWWVCRDESGMNPPQSTSFSVSPPSRPLGSFPSPVCFSVKGNLKPVRFVFLPLLVKCLLLKPRCWLTGNNLSEKHEVDCWVMGEEGRFTRTDFDVSMPSTSGCFHLFIFQTGWTVCQLPVSQQHILLCSADLICTHSHSSLSFSDNDSELCFS